MFLYRNIYQLESNTNEVNFKLYMLALKMPIKILDQVDKYRKDCLWNRGDINRKGGCLLAWKKVTRPKNQCGLGIIDLRAHNSSLPLKFLHKFYNNQNLPWVQLTWAAFYKRVTPLIIGRTLGPFGGVI
jgi:hypothetical protein